jgi:hypothetical protein
MIRQLSIAAIAALATTTVAACPADKAKSAGAETNMSKPSVKYSKAQKATKSITVDSTVSDEKLAKPKA